MEKRILAYSLFLGAMSLVAQLRFDVTAGHDLRVLRAGEEAQLGIVIINDGKEATEAALAYQVTDVDENIILKSTATANVPAGGRTTISIPAPDKYGVYYLRCAFNDEGTPSQANPVRFAYMKPFGPVAPDFKDTFILGVSDHYEGHPDEELELITKAVAWSGITSMRTDIWWNRIEPSEGNWQWDHTDTFMAMLKRYNVKILAILHNGAKWARMNTKPCYTVPGANLWATRPEYEFWRKFVHNYTERFAGQLTHVEIMNEVNIHTYNNFTPEEYAELVHIAMDEVHAIKPEILVSTAGLGSLSTNRTPTPNYYERFFKALDGRFDLFAIHQHGYFGTYLGEMSECTSMLNTYNPGKPWWNTECGYSTSSLSEERLQAEILFGKLLATWAAGGQGYFWYCMRGKPIEDYPPNSGEPYFGLMDQDFQPRPAYVAFNTLTTNLRGATFVENANANEIGGKDVYSYLFRLRDPSQYAFTFNRSGKNSTLQIITGITGRAIEVDLWGNEKELNVTNGTTAVLVGPSPIIVRLEDQTDKPQFKGTFLGTNDFLVFPGTRQDFSFSLHNPTEAALTTTLVFNDMEGLQFIPESQTLTIAPSQEAAFAFSVVSSDALREGDLQMNIFADGLWEGTTSIHVRPAILLGNKFADHPSMTIDDASQNVPLVAVEPATEHLLWKGADDCSARMWMCQRDARLFFRIEVTDDAHCQSWHGSDVWCGDNVQLGIQIPRQNVYWEIGLTRCDDGTSEVFIWILPTGFNKEVSISRIKLSTDRIDNRTIYEAVIPFNVIGLTNNLGHSGFQVNLLINDCDDGETREGFMSAAPSMGTAKESADFPMVCF